MDFSELWIGDDIFIKSKQKLGHWEGMDSSGYAKVKCMHKVYVLPLSDLADAREAPKEVEKVVPQKKTFKVPTFVENTLDLHMEKLNPSLIHQAPELILGHQLRKCTSFIEGAIQSKKIQVTIIHGKGTGALKTEVHNLLDGYEKISHKLDKNDGGATEVWFYY